MSKIRLKTQFINTLRLIFFRNFLAESVLRKFTHKRTLDSLISKLVPNHYQYQSPTYRSVLIGTDTITLDLSELMEWFYYYGFVDPAAEALTNLCRPQDTVIDIGTNIGALLTQLAQKVGPQGQVYGFEPEPTRYKKCMELIRALKISWAEVSCSALGEYKTSAQLKVRDSHNLGMGQISFVANLDSTTPVNITTLDEFVKEKNIEKVNIIKIDVEGFELQSLRGAKETIAKFRPKLFIEIDQKNLAQFNAKPEDILSLIKALGNYELWKNQLGTPLDPVLESCHFDLIAIPKDFP